MARKADGRGKVRADLEEVLLSLADMGECAPVIELRISQAIRRTGMTSLLCPALDDLYRMVKDMADAKSQVCAAIDRLME